MFAIPLLGRSEGFDPENRISMKGSYFQTKAQSFTSLRLWLEKVWHWKAVIVDCIKAKVLRKSKLGR